ncbi:MAG: hypothetical protein K6U02_01615 [Firmicutes bacterium]|nr:hypothetical protein [Bacillota bacterium]
MAEAFARHRHADVLAPASAGLSPLGHIAEPTRQVMAEKGCPVDGQYSKGLPENAGEFDGLIVNMTGRPGLRLFPGARVLDWDVDDPFGDDLAVYRRVRDEIERLVERLAHSLRQPQQSPTGAPPTPM